MRENVFGEVEYGIHEVYYDDNGKIKYWSEKPIRAFGNSVAELEADLLQMRVAITMGVLDLPPITSAADGVTNTTEDKEHNADEQQNAANVVEQGKLNEPTNEQ